MTPRLGPPAKRWSHFVQWLGPWTSRDRRSQGFEGVIWMQSFFLRSHHLIADSNHLARDREVWGDSRPNWLGRWSTALDPHVVFAISQNQNIAEKILSRISTAILFHC
jgi:hypothetical protein